MHESIHSPQRTSLHILLSYAPDHRVMPRVLTPFTVLCQYEGRLEGAYGLVANKETLFVVVRIHGWAAPAVTRRRLES